MKKRNLYLFLLVLVLTGLSCRVDRLFNPALPTFTPTADPQPQEPIPTPTPTPIPTPEPGARIDSGDRAYFYGDWELAAQEYAQAFGAATENEVKSAAMLGLGRTYLKQEQYDAALNTLTTAIASYPNTPSRGDMFFTLGQVYEALGQHLEAVAAFEEYLNLRAGLIDAYIYERIGDNYLTIENYQQGIEAYTSALSASPNGSNFYLNMQIGDSYLALQNYDTALITYEDIFNRTSNDYVKAEAKRKAGDIYLILDNPDQAYLAYQEVVENYPLAYDAYLSLVALIDEGVQVSNLDRGLINYFVGQNGFAVDAFIRYLNEFPDDHSDTAHYYLGLAYLKQGNYPQAIDAWQAIIDEHVNESYWAAAFDEIAYTQNVYLDEPETAIETYLAFVDRSPLHEKSPEYLFYAGRIAERDFDLRTAARLWERIGTQFSTSSSAYEGLFQAGIARFRLGQYENAISTFQSALGVNQNAGETAAAYFWIGKCYQRLGNQDAANDAWLQASTSDPTGYYSERAEDMLAGRAAFTPPASYNFEVDLLAERAEANQWMKTTFGIPQEEDLDDYTPLFSDPRVVRGTELWKLGLFEEARREFDSYRLDVQTDPGKSYRLANYLIELGLYRSGIIAAREVLNLAGFDDAGTFTAPLYFNHLRFGTYYQDIVLPAADEYGFHPLFLYSVIRQESLFEGFVTSTASARGLMQIIPSTGEEIANRLNLVSNYNEDDLYRPLININFGAYYLDRQRDAFGGDLYQALAAYNGGPGNTSTWVNLSDGDPDLFVEVIRFSETRNYIRYITELFSIYRNIYGGD